MLLAETVWILRLRMVQTMSAADSRHAASLHARKIMNDEALKRPLTPDWLNRSRRLLNDAKVAGGDAHALRAQSVELQKNIAKGTLKHQEAVRNTLRKRVAETRSLQTKLTLQVQAISEEMAELELRKAKAEETLERALKPLKLAEKRVRVRAQVFSEAV